MAVPEKEAEGFGAAAQENGTGAERLHYARSGAAAQENGTGAERLHYARSGTQMGNKVRTKNVRIYGEHGVCNTLCLFMDHGGAVIQPLVSSVQNQTKDRGGYRHTL